jgi:hypothetical protein
MYAQTLIDKLFLQKALEYSYGVTSLQDLERYLLPNLNEVLDSNIESIRELAKLVEGASVEIDEGVTSETELKRELQTLLARDMLTTSLVGWTATSTKAMFDDLCLTSELTRVADFKYSPAVT